MAFACLSLRDPIRQNQEFGGLRRQPTGDLRDWLIAESELQRCEHCGASPGTGWVIGAKRGLDPGWGIAEHMHVQKRKCCSPGSSLEPHLMVRARVAAVERVYVGNGGSAVPVGSKIGTPTGGYSTAEKHCRTFSSSWNNLTHLGAASASSDVMRGLALTCQSWQRCRGPLWRRRH